MKLFDSHCHPQFPQYEGDREETIKRALDEGVFMICVGTDLETSKKAIELARGHKGIWATVGLHPNDNLNEDFNPEAYENLLKQEKVVAFGEIGLDYFRTKDKEDQKIQKQRFDEQLDLAMKIDKPVVLHCRNAHEDLIENLKLKIGISPLRGVLHSFTGTIDEAKRYLDLGFYLGFNGILTFASQYEEVVRYSPLERILLETDAPYLTPVPFRGKRNEPLYVRYVARKVAELKGIDYDEVARQTFENTKNLFGINE